MNKSENEVKIAEKLKFWEEQDQINKELIPRVLKNHEMIADLTFQFDKSLNSLSSLNDDIEKLQEKINQECSKNQLSLEAQNKRIGEINESLRVIREQAYQIQEFNKEIQLQKQVIQETKNLFLENNSKEHLPNSRLINIGVVIALILSIIGLVI